MRKKEDYVSQSRFLLIILANNKTTIDKYFLESVKS